MRWRQAEWFDFESGEPLIDLHVGWRPAGEQRRVLTYGDQEAFRSDPRASCRAGREPADAKTYGPLRPSPTEVGIVRLIGREMNMLDRTGVTANPEYSDYTDDGGWRQLVHKAIRIAGASRVSAKTSFARSTVD